MKQWQPGQPLTPRDRALLRPLLDRARALGRTPEVSEIETSAAIKARFRIWKYAVLAVGLPAMNDPEQVRAREAARRAAETQAGTIGDSTVNVRAGSADDSTADAADDSALSHETSESS